MKKLVPIIFITLVVGIAFAVTAHNVGVLRQPVAAPVGAPRPNLAAIFSHNYKQYVDHFGNAARTAFDESGRIIGTQVGTYRPGEPDGMIVDMTYLQPDAEHPRGQAFDGSGKPMPLHLPPQIMPTVFSPA
jgi:hypothetical protein